MTSLFEVITSKTPRSAAYGVTFTDEETANEYARQMEKAGYIADVSPEFLTEPNVETAMAATSDYFKEKALKNQAIKPEKEGIPNNALEAFTLAMELAVSAPTDQLAAHALKKARRLAQFLEPEQVH